LFDQAADRIAGERRDAARWQPGAPSVPPQELIDYLGKRVGRAHVLLGFAVNILIKAGPLADFDGVDLLKVESQRKWEAERMRTMASRLASPASRPAIIIGRGLAKCTLHRAT